MRTLAFALSLFLAGPVHAAIEGQEVTYTADGVTLKGYLAYDAAKKGKAPGVLVVHEWWGHNEYARSRARQLAELGYVALALDLFGQGKKADHPDTAKKFVAELNRQKGAAKARFEAALSYLKSQGRVDPTQIAALGYCFGGGVVLNMARSGLPLKAAISYHGPLATETPAKAGEIKGRILVFTGAKDPNIPPEQVEAFKKEMTRAGADYEVVVYPNAKHGFTNPAADELGKEFKMPLAYDAEADRDSWQTTRIFLAETFKRGK